MEATAKELQTNELFTDLTEEESSTVSGGHYYGGYCGYRRFYGYRPVYYHRPYYGYYRPRYRPVAYYYYW
ncbi:hypothetical protein J5X98_05920 [Leptothermofonsia sichuanensis E412]|uniref:hypothetical protein n=1 Tax=Leptothermofonsia sichuanensis TaxID=2917832 RepID=UPI001CA65BBF|nr:hypothetical protein [Leptothermofonsia sichuanensis]QZZ21955.1 hypothetical protein J5X98_05920 [Leptothermofonsia sichuanensis E412]